MTFTPKRTAGLLCYGINVYDLNCLYCFSMNMGKVHKKINATLFQILAVSFDPSYAGSFNASPNYVKCKKKKPIRADVKRVNKVLAVLFYFDSFTE